MFDDETKSWIKVFGFHFIVLGHRKGGKKKMKQRQDARFRGFMGRLSDWRFAWKFYGLHVVLGLCLTAFSLWRFQLLMTETSTQTQTQTLSLNHRLCVDPSSTPKILWEDFITHSCESNNLWILIDGFVYDVQNFSLPLLPLPLS